MTTEITIFCIQRLATDRTFHDLMIYTKRTIMCTRMKSSVYRRPCNYNIIDFEFKTQVYIVFFLQNNDVSFEKSFVSFVKLKI